MLLESHPQLLSMLISRKPDIILAKMRSALDANCSLLEIPYILVANGPQAACYR
jgi:predicted glycosyltransferase